MSDFKIVLFGHSTPISFWENLESRYRKELDRIYNIDVGEVDAITRGKANQTYYSGPKDQRDVLLEIMETMKYVGLGVFLFIILLGLGCFATEQVIDWIKCKRGK